MPIARRLLPHPILTAMLTVVWVLLVNDYSPGVFAFGLILGLIIPLITAPFWQDRPRVRQPLRIVEYGLVVLYDIVVANIEVALLILFKRNRDLRPCFISIPLELTAPEAITVLAGTITMTPGTVSADISADGHALLVHCLHAPDGEAVANQIKQRYEGRLKEIFE
ncbi:Na+/H+ antiporter subunit E [Marivibrio halodurans]|uniref:Na+/H+ antiporter subunit E n=1 Tax=Marivibrio halodurans TaxID=2039722 RepID=UPI001FE5E2C9|nr:Na+/H+ antiporter subunit E [Marivibrio halodurans]